MPRHVKAKERATSREQQVRTTASSVLSNDEVDRMVRDDEGRAVTARSTRTLQRPRPRHHPCWRKNGVQLGIFALSAAVSLGTSVLLVSRLERVGERLGLSEALLGLLAALAADGPEITASVTAIAGGGTTVGIGVTLGSNVFNLAALLGLSALIAGRVGFHRRSVLLEGGVGLLIALVGLVVVGGLIAPVVGLILALLAFVPYVAYSAEHPAVRARRHLPGAGRTGWPVPWTRRRRNWPSRSVPGGETAGMQGWPSSR